MTPKIKANELAVKMLYAINENPTITELFINEPKKCALIAADEIIEIMELNENPLGLGYWQEVKQEIEKL